MTVRPGKKPDVSAGLAVGVKLHGEVKRAGTPTGIGKEPGVNSDVFDAVPADRDSGSRLPRYVVVCKVRIRHGSETYGVALWEGADHLAATSIEVAQRAMGLTLGIVVVEANPWRALGEEDIPDIWRFMPPGSVIRPIHCEQAATLLVERPDGTFSQVGASPIVSDIPGALRLAYGPDATIGDAPHDTWAVRRPFHLR